MPDCEKGIDEALLLAIVAASGAKWGIVGSGEEVGHRPAVALGPLPTTSGRSDGHSGPRANDDGPAVSAGPSNSSRSQQTGRERDQCCPASCGTRWTTRGGWPSRLASAPSLKAAPLSPAGSTAASRSIPGPAGAPPQHPLPP